MGRDAGCWFCGVETGRNVVCQGCLKTLGTERGEGLLRARHGQFRPPTHWSGVTLGLAAGALLCAGVSAALLAAQSGSDLEAGPSSVRDRWASRAPVEQALVLALVRQASDARWSVEYDRALEFANQALALDPSQAEAYYERAMVTRYRGLNLDSALRDMNTAAELAPANPLIRGEVGAVRVARGELEAGLAHQTAALELPGANRDWLHLARGVTKALLGDYPGAVADLRAAERKTYVYPSLWLAALGEPVDFDQFRGQELDRWSQLMVAHFQGFVSQEALLHGAGICPPGTAGQTHDGRLREAHGFLGMLAELAGEREQALGHYRAVIALGSCGWLQHDWACNRLRQLGVEPELVRPRERGREGVEGD